MYRSQLETFAYITDGARLYEVTEIVGARVWIEDCSSPIATPIRTVKFATEFVVNGKWKLVKSPDQRLADSHL